ncbi:c-type cytochrome [Zunongwangia pacifica]|uniref:Cytochrome c n=1 Tax=Zunongwangia pacifica TaxID=2911062 RepID=A0A9X2CIG5_9FLAO|nr:cytochrome c [Zunongwangia pacifica]MCL6216781.1 cytochrome c [Zunongwangia pacifica]
MRSLFHKSLIFVIIAGFLSSCAGDRDRNYQYFPDMYRPVPYEPYGAYDIFANQQEAKLPVDGTIPRGWMPYDYEDTPEGRANAKANLKNPLPYTEDNLTKGKALYTVYCAVCHGDKGNGQGTLVEREKILGVPSYDDPGRSITEGSVYHAMYYGLNNMGSYGVQTSIKERWQIDHYVMSLKDKLEGKPERAFQTNTVTQENSDNLNPAEPAEDLSQQDQTQSEE